MSRTPFTFPVGYHSFHPKQAFNFQLNRFHSMCAARYEDMEEAGQRIATIHDWRVEMERLADHALADGRWMNATTYYRAAEFYLTRDNVDKELLYERAMQMFEQAVARDTVERSEVPFGEGALSVMRLRPECGEARSTIVVHGGNDSFIEELYPLLCHLADQGHEVIAFEGPGQGRCLKKHGLGLTHEWEKPTGAILDAFELDDVTLVGISMGGWLCLRAAAYDRRIKRVIPWSVSFDVLQYTNRMGQMMAKLMFRRFRRFVGKAIARRMQKDVEYAWFVSNLMYITRQPGPLEAFDVLFRFNEENLQAQRVTQDVLILTGRDDHLVPFKMHDLQVKALTHARSVTGRVFTEKDHAGSHCQIGNLQLALDVMTDWIAEKLEQGRLPG